MTELLGAVGWGLLASGAASHVFHHARFRELLALHLDRERLPAAAIVVLELFFVITIPAALLTESAWLRTVALAASALGLGFVIWIVRLLLQGSTLPCACSFSAAPTSRWSLLRAVSVLLVASYALGDSASVDAATVATLLVGLAIAAAIFVLPEALGWPPASRALMQRVDAFQEGSQS